MLWVKAFHIVFVASWFAGLFYLPRIFVNLAMVAPDSVAERERLLLMARKLLRFTTVLALPSLALGLWLWLGYGIGRGPGNGSGDRRRGPAGRTVGAEHARAARRRATDRWRRHDRRGPGRAATGLHAGRRADRPERSVLVRIRCEVQEVPRSLNRTRPTDPPIRHPRAAPAHAPG